MNPIAKRIQEARLKAKLSEKELAKKCGVAPSYIIQIESGKKIINEATAEKILSVFGEKVGFDFADIIERERIQEEVIAADIKAKLPKQAQAAPSFYQVEPTEQWAGALANIIKKFPIHDVVSSKVLGEKELPILSKKVEGIPAEKVLFVSASDDKLASLRILKGDVLMIHQMKEYASKGVYLIEYQGKKSLVLLSRETGNTYGITSGQGAEKQVVQSNLIKLIGKAVRVEFTL